jgi:hypothetical protein
MRTGIAELRLVKDGLVMVLEGAGRAVRLRASMPSTCVTY